MIPLLEQLSLPQACDGIRRFKRQYVREWKVWLEVSACLDVPGTRFIPDGVSEQFGKLLWSWRACGRSQRPRCAEELSKTLHKSLSFTQGLIGSDLRSLASPPDSLRVLIEGLWYVFRGGICKDIAWEVAISKSILLTTRGRIGPAFDSNVQSRLGIHSILDADSFVSTVSCVARQLAVFEEHHHIRIESLVPVDAGAVAVGRAVDMLLGPKERN
jgi:hypothetical protein